MKENNIKFNVIGFRDKLPQKINAQLDFAISETKNNDGLKLNLALAYGARSELIHAFSLLIDQLTYDNLKIDYINEEIISQNLFTKDIPDPDLLIRTGGENRLSNFLLWQSAYTELYFSNKFWPDFNKQDLYEALHDYERRDRRFGRVNL